MLQLHLALVYVKINETAKLANYLLNRPTPEFGFMSNKLRDRSVARNHFGALDFGVSLISAYFYAFFYFIKARNGFI